MEEKIVYYTGIADEVMWGQGECMRINLKLKEKVDEEALKIAVERTQKCYVAMRVKPILHKERVCYIANHKPVIIRQIPRLEAVEFGGELTNDYPIKKSARIY